MSLKIALFGAGGQVGREAVAAAATDSSLSLFSLHRSDADLLDPGAATSAVDRIKPDVVINAAAWTAVDKAESETQSAFRINAAAAGEIAGACAASGARLIHLSTDYVFAGDNGGMPLDETAPVSPQNVYGASKLAGEELVSANFSSAVILRTSWVYSSHGTNFVKTMLRLGETRNAVGVVDDQIGGPTPASSIASACLALARRADGPGGVYHFQGAPAASWADVAEAIFSAARKSVSVNRIRTADYPTPAKRPLYTVLNCSKILRDYGIIAPDWRADIAGTVDRINKSMSHRT
jgi:dTDP-4-dehydrorhamnose reductase